jgi:hypothetical protein
MPPAHPHSSARRGKADANFYGIRRIYVMTSEHYLMLQASIISVLLFLVGATTVIQHPEWFQ